MSLKRTLPLAALVLAGCLSSDRAKEKDLTALSWAERGRAHLLRDETVEAERCFRVALDQKKDGTLTSAERGLAHEYRMLAELFNGRGKDALCEAQTMAFVPQGVSSNNAALFWLSGVVCETGGKAEEARLNYVRAAGRVKGNPFFENDLMRAEVGVRYPLKDRSRVAVIFESESAASVLFRLGDEKPSPAAPAAEAGSRRQFVWESVKAKPGRCDLTVSAGERKLSVPLTLVAGDTAFVWIVDTGRDFHFSVKR